MKYAVAAFLVSAIVLGAIGGTLLRQHDESTGSYPRHAGTLAPVHPATVPPWTPSAAPTAVPTAVPTLPPADLRPPTNPPVTPHSVAPVVYSNRVTGPGVNAGIAGTYTDCTGKAPVGWAGAYFDSCFPAPWVMAHPMFFGGMNGWSVGTTVTWWDGNSVPHVYHIIDITTYPSGATGVRVDGAAHFQVCELNIANSPVRVLNAA